MEVKSEERSHRRKTCSPRSQEPQGKGRRPTCSGGKAGLGVPARAVSRLRGQGGGQGGGALLPPKEGACVSLSVLRLASGLSAWAATWAFRMTTCAGSANRPPWSLLPSPSALGAAPTPCLLSLHVTAGCHWLHLPLDRRLSWFQGLHTPLLHGIFQSHLPPPPSNSRSPGEGAPTRPLLPHVFPPAHP